MFLGTHEPAIVSPTAPRYCLYFVALEPLPARRRSGWCDGAIRTSAAVCPVWDHTL